MSTLPVCAALLLLPALLGTTAAHAQQAVATALRRNVVRLDLLGPHYQNLTYNLLRSNGPFLFPVLLGYERQVGHSRFSGNVEVLLNGGTPATPLRGLALQGRYYRPSARYPTSAAGFYVAPTVGVRQVRPRFSGDPATGTLVGEGLLLGWQWPFRPQWRLDVGAGGMNWNIVDGNPAPAPYDVRYNRFRGGSEDFEHERVLFDARVSVGYAF